MMANSKDPIRLRQRKTKSGLVSLYLDVYLNGKRSYEYLKLYLIPEKSREDRRKNQETLALAEAIRAKRLVELRNNEYGFRPAFEEDCSFYEYFSLMRESRLKSDSVWNWHNWGACLKHLLKYEPRLKELKWKDIDGSFVKGFKDYLEKEARTISGKPLSQNSKVTYFKKLRACINQAYKERIIAYNPAGCVESISPEEVERMYLSVEEIRRLVKSECGHPAVKSAFLFSCLTGLRRSDVLRITWGDTYDQDGFTRLIFKQKKTKGQEYLDITHDARLLMGERGEPDKHPFAKLPPPYQTNKVLQDWVSRAGIDKKITFHCGRHTFAVMMLDLGTDLYVVSKLLGHREIGTTQIYAKILDKNKQAAISKIPRILDADKE